MFLTRVKKILLFCVFFVVSFYLYANVLPPGNYTNPPWNPVVSCTSTKKEIENLLRLAYDAHRVLSSLGIEHWLMYGSLWGVRRINGPLPWDNDVDIGFHGQGKFAQMGLSEYIAAFEVQGLTVEDKWLQSGNIKISRSDCNLTIDTFAFYNDNGVMKRRGLESWLFALNYKLHHTFPARLVQPPLPKKRFGFFNISVPREGMEILKFLYRYSWWKVVKPKGCE